MKAFATAEFGTNVHVQVNDEETSAITNARQRSQIAGANVRPRAMRLVSAYIMITKLLAARLRLQMQKDAVMHSEKQLNV